MCVHHLGLPVALFSNSYSYAKLHQLHDVNLCHIQENQHRIGSFVRWMTAWLLPLSLLQIGPGQQGLHFIYMCVYFLIYVIHHVSSLWSRDSLSNIAVVLCVKDVDHPERLCCHNCMLCRFCLCCRPQGKVNTR